MNNNFQKTLVLILFLILIIAASVAIPFVLRKDAVVQTPVPVEEEEPWDVVITIKADLVGNVGFTFQDYKIHYKHDVRYEYPLNASVNGIPWADLEKPFEMGFTPDFTFAKIYEKQGNGDVELSVEDGQFKVSILDSGWTATPYQVSIAMRRAPEAPVATEPEAEAKADGESADAAPKAENDGESADDAPKAEDDGESADDAPKAENDGENADDISEVELDDWNYDLPEAD